MRFHSRFKLLILAGLCVSIQANAQVGSSASATTSVVDPAVLARISDLDFGHIPADSGITTLVVEPRASSGASNGAQSTQSATPASITITGASHQSYSVSLPETAHTLTQQDGSATVSVRDFSSDLPEGMLVSGSRTVRIGATLSMEKTQAPGLYTAQVGIPVTVNYN